MLLGRYPHNTGYKMNSDMPSVQAYIAQHNDTVGNWLKQSGYYTACVCGLCAPKCRGCAGNRARACRLRQRRGGGGQTLVSYCGGL